MLQRISWIGLVALFSLGIMAVCYHDYAQAGTYKLEYPQGWGTCCPPNTHDFGYFRTGWREWPGEVRLDKTFPRAIGTEVLPTPAGQEIIPPPKAIAPKKIPSEIQPVPGPEETMPPSEGLPTEPGMETPVLPKPGLPEEPGGFNPLPSLPPDLNAPAPLNPKEKEENAPAAEPKQENKPQDESPEKNLNESSAPGSKTDDKGTSIIMPSNIAREITYQEPAESPISARLLRDVVRQSYQPPSGTGEASAVVHSGLQVDSPDNALQPNPLKVALDGFCPVELSLHGRWSQGDPRWTVVYKGFIYRLSSNAQRQAFLANPEKYIPVNGGFDPVVSATEKRNVPGQVRFCAAYKGRIYMFASAATQEYFHKNPELYIGGAAK